MTNCGGRSVGISAIIRSGVLGLALCVLGACGTVQQMQKGVRPERLVSRDSSDKAEIYSEIAAAQKQRSEAYVQIIGGDIELPLTAGQDKTSDVRTYNIDVWFDDSVLGEGGVTAALERGDVVVEVLGAKAKIVSAKYGEKGKSPLPESRSKILIEIDSRDLSQSFTVIAKVVRHAAKWQEEQDIKLDEMRAKLFNAMQSCGMYCRAYLHKKREAIAKHGSRAIPQADGSMDAYNYIVSGEAYEREESAQNPHMAVKLIRVFNGDLHTQIYMLSDEETKDAFGTNFAKYFYVGRAYFRNRHTDKKLIVHTTSLRARTVFYREPVDDNDSGAWLNPFPRSNDGQDNATPYARYDYIVAGGDRHKKLLTVGEEDVIYGLVRSKDVIRKIIDRNGIDDPIRKSILEMTYSLLNYSGIDVGKWKEDRIREFVGFALETTRQAIDTCQLEGETNPGVRALIYEKAYLLIESSPDAGSLADALRPHTNTTKDDATIKFAECIVGLQQKATRNRARALSDASPLALDLRKRVGLTDKIAASSRDTYWQQRLAGHGYLWQDYYRPMTFESVLLSLSAKTKAHPNNRLIEYLQSIGVIAGSLVGLTDISSRFGTEDFAQRVAVTTGVFVPEVRKLIMRDLDQYLSNLAATALPSIITLAPNESRDGYVFFPRGSIYGYGVDEFSLNEPSFIVNIDNEDVAVDGALIEGEKPFASGQRAMDMVQSARDQGKSRVDDDLKKLADLQARVFAYRMQHISNNVCEMISSGAERTKILAYLNTVASGEKSAADSQLFAELRARAQEGISCDKQVPPEEPQN